MKYACLLTAIVAGSLIACGGGAPEQAAPAAPPAPAAPANDLPAVDVKAALGAVVPDLEQRLARFKPVQMAFDSSRYTQRERQMIDQLVLACRYLESMFWRQSDPEGLALFKALENDPAPAAQNLRHYLLINGSRWDLVDENRPFVGTMPEPPGNALYPPNLTRETIDSYLAAHPEKKAEIYGLYTVVKDDGKGNLSGRSYHDEYKPFAEKAAAALRQAATFSDDPAFANFLRLRADAMLTENYYPSDIAWIDLQNPKFDIIYGSQETYLDNLLGVKTSFGAAILIRNDAESENLAKYQQWIGDLQDALPLAAADRPSRRGHATPMEVMDSPYRAGDLRHGYQAVAVNLPNDPRIHQEKGTKKVFFKNFMDARVNEVILPLASRVMDEAQAKQASADAYLAWVVMHEISHGLGPAFATRGGKQTDIREAIGPLYGGLEEAKADVVGALALKWLVDKGVLEKSRLEEYYASYIAGIFRTVRFGTGEAHGRAVMMEFNFLSELGAITANGGRYQIQYAKMPAAIDRLARELLEQEARGDRARAEAWFAKYDKMPEALKSALDAAKDVPIDVDPTFALPEVIE
jgi:peptidase M49-like protein